ncbi:Thiamine-monophosphate kinase [Methanosarcinaceae archaeon Ag5]|uniref:Thiamine-monophosphate kinase n=1 Tax=Methanolapillus africanus TaxID=3028297 RepID=A0AAE4MKK7_9EURY|nr:Thiamine-monophosphate kinase [Methanosarcinaceae archaeon Ag5]
MDLEGYAKQFIINNDPGAGEKLQKRITEIKNITDADAKKIADAVLEEVSLTLDLTGDVFSFQKSGVTVGNFGVGSRGTGDFYVHSKIGDVIGKTGAVLDASNLDDSGVVSVPSDLTDSFDLTGSSGHSDLSGDNSFLILTVDGMHSRLSSYPFLAGFHVARAALRDIYVMGAKPLAMLSDIHVADDGDVSMIFDHLAGISAVSELSGIPLVTGSTLRIGGDMVIGDRMTGCVGAAAVSGAATLTARKQAVPGDLILMSRGAGGGTITTAAIYSGYVDAEAVVERTLNVDFLTACQAILDDGLNRRIHVMTDVTNGGIRGDAHEISKEANVRLVFEDDKLKQCVDPVVSKMLDALSIDFRGVSIDSLLVICPPDVAKLVMKAVQKIGSEIFVVGRVEEKLQGKPGAVLIRNGEEMDFKPLFREAPYTPLKKAIGEQTPPDFEEMRLKVDEAAAASILKKERIVKRIRENGQ